LNQAVNFEELIAPYRDLYSSIGAEGIDGSVAKGQLLKKVSKR
jgi:hypothetical protein